MVKGTVSVYTSRILDQDIHKIVPTQFNWFPILVLSLDRLKQEHRFFRDLQSWNRCLAVFPLPVVFDHFK